MCHKLDRGFFSELSKMDPADVCRRALCRHDPQGFFELDAWGAAFQVDPEKAEIRPEPGAPGPDLELGLAIIFYLLRAQEVPLKNEWVSEKDLPGGVSFFRGPHAVPARLITERFQDDLTAFQKACAALHGQPADMADAAFVFRVLPRVPVAVLYWKGDREFDAEAKMLFDRTISEHLPLDVIFGLAVEMCGRISRR